MPNDGGKRSFVRRIALDVSPLRASRDFRRLWLGLLASQFGSQFTIVATYVQVFNLTESPAAVGLLGLVGFLGLVVGFRSILVPVKAMVLNMLSVAAAYGAVVVVMQEGRGAKLLGLSEPLGAVFPAVPILVFCTVFGLSMDYEVFLVARVAELCGEYDRHPASCDEARALLRLRPAAQRAEAKAAAS